MPQRLDGTHAAAAAATLAGLDNGSDHIAATWVALAEADPATGTRTQCLL